MATTSSEQRAAGHVASHTDAPQEDFAQARPIILNLYIAMYIPAVQGLIDMCSVPLGHALLSFVPVTANPFESASLFTTCIVATVWADVFFFITFFCFFASLMVAMFRERCSIDLLHWLFNADCTPERGDARARKFVMRDALLELLKVICLALFSLAYRSLGGGETAHAVLTPSQAFLSMVVGKMTIGLIIIHWLIAQGDMAQNFDREGSTLDGRDSGYASTAASEGDD